MTRPQQQRKRAWRPKVRSGCGACKLGHHKCDEQKPACSRCLQHGRACVYVSATADASNSSSVVKVGNQSQDSLLAIRPKQRSPDRRHLYHGHEPHHNLGVAVPTLLRPSSISTDPRYGIYYDHFRYHVAFKLGAAAFGDFWRRAVLRESTRDQCILNAILALGSLDRASKSDPLAASTPLFTAFPSSLSRCRKRASPEHYLESIMLYSKALEEFRGRVATQAASPRTTLMVTLLLVAFEHLHGNTDAVDRITTRGLALLRRNGTRPKERASLVSEIDHGKESEEIKGPDPAVPVAASIDDDGIRLADFLLEQIVSLNALYASLYPSCGSLVHARVLANKSKTSRYFVPPLGRYSSMAEIRYAWMACLSAVGAWRLEAHRSALQSYVDKIPLDAELLEERKHYETQMEILLGVVRSKLSDEPVASDLDSSKLPNQILAERNDDEDNQDTFMPAIGEADMSALKRLKIAASCAVLSVTTATDPTNETWNKFIPELHDMLDRVGDVLDDMTPELRESGVLYDDMLGVTAHLAHENRDYDVRKKAMARWARMISPRSGWDNKSCFMASVALIAVEEEGRLPPAVGEDHQTVSGQQSGSAASSDGIGSVASQGRSQGAQLHGRIPIEAQYMWTGGEWNDEYTRYTVSLYPKVIAQVEERGRSTDSPERKVVLDLEDFPFGRNGAGNLDTVARLQKHLGR